MLSPKRIRLFLAVGFVASLLVFLTLTFDSSKINTEAQAVTQQERQLEFKIPKQVPIKIKIRAEKEKAVKDLSNTKWTRDFELDVTNTSGKPIYFLELWLVFPEVLSQNGYRIGIPLRYGRMDFIHFSTLATPDDVPIPAEGEYTVKIPDDDQRGWDWHKATYHAVDPKKIQIEFVQISFGDGSGFDGDAMPYPYKRQQSSTGLCREGPAQVVASAPSMAKAASTVPSTSCRRYFDCTESLPAKNVSITP